MAYWLVKSEPSAWSWDQQVAKGAKGEAWTGVRNFTARQNLVKMKPAITLSSIIPTRARRSSASPRSLGRRSRPQRQNRQVRLRRFEGRKTVEDPGDDGRDQGRQAAERHGAGEIFPPVGAAGYRGRVEDRLQDGRDVVLGDLTRRASAVSKDGCLALMVRDAR